MWQLILASDRLRAKNAHMDPMLNFFRSCCLLTGLLSCNLGSEVKQEPRDIAGGPCSYDEYRIPARIIVFDVLDSASIDVSFKLDSNDLLQPPYDTIHFYMEMGRFMNKKEADSLHLQKGKALTYLIQRITSGSCTPEINTLLLETME
jgi:hypothetical protein